MAEPRELVKKIEGGVELPEGVEERSAGYGVMGLPFASGHVLGLRRWPASSLGPGYTSIWHRDPEGRWTFYQDVAVEDIASVVVGILADPELRHVGKAYAVTGVTEMSMTEIAETIGRVLGKTVEYVDIPTEAWLEQLSKAPFMNPHFLKHLERVAWDTSNGFFGGVTDVVEKVGGRTPKSLETFVRENIAAFGGAQMSAVQ